MLMGAKKILKLYMRYFKLNLASQMEYRVSFIVQVFGMVLNNASFIFFWWVAFDITGSDIAGYSMRDVMFIWAVASSAFGFASILFANVSQISSLIITGELDTFLLQPMPVLANLLGARTQVSAWGDFIYGWVILFIFWDVSVGILSIFLLSIILGAVIFVSVKIIFHTLTFYLGYAQMITSAASEFMISFSIYPEGIFTGFVRLLIYSLLPAAFVTHIPLDLVKDFDISKFVIWILFAVVHFIIACWFFGKGLKKYESGNLIITRM